MSLTVRCAAGAALDVANENLQCIIDQVNETEDWVWTKSADGIWEIRAPDLKFSEFTAKHMVVMLQQLCKGISRESMVQVSH